MQKYSKRGRDVRAEGVGFEPTGTCIPKLFKSFAFGRSAIPPDLLLLYADPAPQSAYPVVGRLPGRFGVSPSLRSLGSGGGIRTEEFQRGQGGVEIPEAVGHHLVVDVSVEVDDETVITEPFLGRARFQLGEVDVASRELPEDPMAAARLVVELEADDARLVVPGGCRDPELGPGDQHA